MTETPTDAPLTLDAASFAFGDVTVLDDAGVELRAGDLTALVGPNGSGKTTVLELLAGLRAPDSGAVGRPTGTARPVAYLPQQPRFRAGFSVAETLGFYARLVDAEVDTDALLERVGLGDARDRPVTALSGGMTRLLGVAQALVGDPPALVLDEPTSGLDPDVADHIFDVVEAIAADDRLVVIASHDLAAIEERADRVLALGGGEFVLDGPPAALCDATDSDSLREAFSASVGGEARGAVDVRAARSGGDE
ncbi:ABC transporter ATP-binding protein [Halostella salina]|uniref:ABC transporter ATP-binding protein n=1 Tax=Halostella salina TaxID=1547897 RepID=UPI000EF81F91|nr:ABC transporter ATP-binding protein [Halostella salina]